MDTHNKPWHVQPALTRERLEFVAKVLLRVALDAFAGHEPSKGDGSWGLGCRRYERSRHALINAVSSGEVPWLTAVRDNNGPLAMNLGIGGCPIRYVSGDSIHPDQHHILRAQEQAELWPSALDADGWCWLIVVERDERGKATQVVVEQANPSGDIRYRWVAAREKEEAPPSISQPGREIPPPVIGGPNGKKAASDRSGEGS